VEGKDFQVISKFARKLRYTRVANRADFAVVPVGGFNPERIRSLKKGMETTLGDSIKAIAILDRDYRSEEETSAIVEECNSFCKLVILHKCKEIENFLLVPTAIDRATNRRVKDRNKRSGKNQEFEQCADDILDAFTAERKTFITSRYIAARQQFDRSCSPGVNTTTSSESALKELEELWSEKKNRLRLVSGEEALSAINQRLQERFGVSVTHTSIIDAMQVDEITEEMCDLIKSLSQNTEVG